jgi:hypothetical protein
MIPSNMNFQNRPTIFSEELQTSLPQPQIIRNTYRGDHFVSVNLTNTFRDGIGVVKGTTYIVKSSVGIYPTSGASFDYAYRRNLVDAITRKFKSLSSNEIMNFSLRTARCKKLYPESHLACLPFASDSAAPMNCLSTS